MSHYLSMIETDIEKLKGLMESPVTEESSLTLLKLIDNIVFNSVNLEYEIEKAVKK